MDAAPQKWARSSLLVQPQPTVKALAKEHIRSRALSAEMKELALLPRESAGASESLSSLAIKCEPEQSPFCDVSTGIQSAHTAFGEEPVSFASPDLAADHQSVYASRVVRSGHGLGTDSGYRSRNSCWSVACTKIRGLRAGYVHDHECRHIRHSKAGARSVNLVSRHLGLKCLLLC